MDIYLKGEKFQLLSDKALYWPEKKYLFVADLHFGKIMHFRKAGIGIPSGAILDNLERFSHLLLNLDLERVLLLGDLFHSEVNHEWSMLTELISSIPDIRFELILGNHDILTEEEYQQMGLYTQKSLRLNKFIFTHHPLKNIPDGLYNICGHIHPGVRLRGSARQSLRLPCFFFGKTQGILPAFGSFTGMKLMEVGKEDQVYVIANDEIMKIN